MTLNPALNEPTFISSKRDFLKINKDSNRIALKDRARLKILQSPSTFGDLDEAEMSEEEIDQFNISKKPSFEIVSKCSNNNLKKGDNYISSKSNNLVSSTFNPDFTQSISQNWKISKFMQAAHDNIGNRIEEQKNEVINDFSFDKKFQNSSSHYDDLEQRKERIYEKKVNKVREYLYKQLK